MNLSLFKPCPQLKDISWWDFFCSLKPHKNRGFLIENWGGENWVFFGVHPEYWVEGLQADGIFTKWKDLTQKTCPNTSEKEGVWVGVLGYSIVREFENIILPSENTLNQPDLMFGFYKQIFAFHLATQEWFGLGADSFDFSKVVIKKSEEMQPFEVTEINLPIQSQEYESWVKSSIDYILEGDIFQANISHPLKFNYLGDPLQLYSNMREVNPSPWQSCFFSNEIAILSNSPELLVKKVGSRLITKPIAGTRRRGVTSAEDELFALELKESLKEKAEHAMLVDLERNDLGRVSQFGSVQVELLGDVEKYQNVMHLVSTVTGELQEGLDLFDVLRAVFPGGTITGAPKIRSMEIIAELESSPRGFYTGALGWFDGTDFEFNILIRTAILNENQGEVRVGAGIVADSIPAREYKETLNKAAAWIKLLNQSKREKE